MKEQMWLGRNSHGAWGSVKASGRSFEPIKSRIPSNSKYYSLHFQRSIVWATDQSQYDEPVLESISPLILLNSNSSAMWMRDINPPTNWITSHGCSSIIAIVLVMFIRCRHCHVLHSKNGTIFTLPTLSTNNQIPMLCGIHEEPIFSAFSIVRKSYTSTPCHNSFLIWEKHMFVECANVPNTHYWEMHQSLSELPTLDIYSVGKLERNVDMISVDWCLDVIKIYS